MWVIDQLQKHSETALDIPEKAARLLPDTVRLTRILSAMH